MDGRIVFELSSARMTIWEGMERIVGGIYGLVSSDAGMIGLSRSQDITVYRQE